MYQTDRMPTDAPPEVVLIDLLMAVMDSLQTWTAAAGDARAGLAWRDAVTARMIEARAYVDYERLVGEEARAVGLPEDASGALFDAWERMRSWPDAGALARLELPYAFVTNCSDRLARIAAERSGLDPQFTLSAEEAGWFKPDTRTYREACRRLGSPPSEAAMVAGSPYDARGALEAGMQSWLVLRREPDRALPEEIRTAQTLQEVVDDMDRGRAVKR
jgi:2-haloacid dehalogenase